MGVFMGACAPCSVCGVPCANACDPGDETCADDVVAGRRRRATGGLVRRTPYVGVSFGARSGSLAAQVSIGVETNCAGILLSVKQNYTFVPCETLSEPKDKDAICPAYTDVLRE